MDHQDQAQDNSGLYPDIDSLIQATKFPEALKLVEERLASSNLSEAQQSFLLSNRSLCRVGMAALLLNAGKESRGSGDGASAEKHFRKSIKIVEEHLEEFGLDRTLAQQMTSEMQKLVANCRHEHLEQAHRDRAEIISALSVMLPDSLARRALQVLMDAYFELGCIAQQGRSEEARKYVGDIVDALEEGDCAKALEKIEMERLRSTKSEQLVEHLDWAEKAARSILIGRRFESGNKCFENQESEVALRHYGEIAKIMKGKYALFGLNEAALPDLVKDFESKLRSGAIASYEDSLRFRESYMTPLQQHFGDSPDWQTITMVLDAQMAIAFYKRLGEVKPEYLKPKKRSKGPGKKRSLLYRLFRTWLWLWSFGLIKRN